MLCMRSRAIKVVVLLLIAILPIRVVAAAMPSLCAEGQAQAASQAHDHLGHGSPQHHQDQNHDESKGELDHDCGFCAKHCHGAAVVLSADRPHIPAAPVVDAIAFHAWLTAGFVPGRLDRPPLPL